MALDYEDIFRSFRDELSCTECVATPDITKKIKRFFQEKYCTDCVLPSDKEKEFLVDILVCTTSPRRLLSGSAERQPSFEAKIAVESELGGEGGGAPNYLARNVAEDFAKLLILKCELKILIFTSLPLSRETSHLNNRVTDLHSVYLRAGSPGVILLIHLKGEPKKSQGGFPTNPKVSLQAEDMSAFLFAPDIEFRRLEL